MNKLLYLSNVLEQTGYSIAAENTLKALYYNKIPIAARNIQLTSSKREPDSIIKKLLEKDSDDADVLLIHSLPRYFEYDGRFKKCIGRYDWECYTLIPTSWKKKIHLMDEVWVSSLHMKYSILDNKFSKQPKIRVVPHPINPLRFEDNTSAVCTNEHLDKIRQAKTDKTFIFYTIGEFVARKNFEDLLKCWYLAFGRSHNVQLIIKTSKSGATQEQIKEASEKMMGQIKHNLKLNNRLCPNPIFITDYWSDNEIDELHKVADCFVTTSHGEGWCQPAVDALCFGKFVIAPNHTAFQDYLINKDYGTAIPAHSSPCYGALDSGKDIYNGHNSWYNIDLDYLIDKMRHVGGCPDYYKKKGLLGKELVNWYSYANMGKIMKKYLYE